MLTLGSEANRIIDMINVLDAKVKYIVLTHSHADHLMAVPEIREKCGGKVLISRIESEYMKTAGSLIFDTLNLPTIEVPIDSRLDDNDEIHLGNITFKVIATPRTHSWKYLFVLC